MGTKDRVPRPRAAQAHPLPSDSSAADARLSSGRCYGRQFCWSNEDQESAKSYEQANDFGLGVGKKKILTRINRYNPQIVINNTSEVQKRETDVVKEPENCLKLLSSRMRFLEVRGKPTTNRTGSDNDQTAAATTTNVKCGGNAMNKQYTSDRFSVKNSGAVVAASETTGGTSQNLLKDGKFQLKAAVKNSSELVPSPNSFLNPNISVNKPAKSTSTCANQKERTPAFPYPDPFQSSSAKFMQRVSEMSSLEAETKKWEINQAKIKKRI